MILEKVVIGVGLLVVYFLDGSSLFELGNAIKPDFMAVFVVFFALRKGASYGLWIGFFGGLLTDTALGGEIGPMGQMSYKIGLHSLVFSLLGYITGKITRSAFNENYFSITIYVFAFTLLSRLATYFIYTLVFYPNENYSFLTTSVYNGVIAPLAFFILTWLYKMENSQDG